MVCNLPAWRTIPAIKKEEVIAYPTALCFDARRRLVLFLVGSQPFYVQHGRYSTEKPQFRE
jgi:hypothetical protein